MPESAVAQLIYEGSVKNLWTRGPGRLEFEYTDAYSVFDWGRMPDELAHKGESLATLGAFFFKALENGALWKRVRGSSWLKGLSGRLASVVEAELAVLEREGLRSHFVERSAANRLVVEKVGVFRPETVSYEGLTLNRYATKGWGESSRLLPLEVVFRFGMPKGSSLVDRLTPDYARELGLASVPREGEFFDRPIVEFFTKLEDTDRFLSWEQALNYSGLEIALFEKLLARTVLLSVWLFDLMGAKGLELWDGKFEWALLEGKLALVDSIGPDELRLLDPKSGAQISKEFLRLFYRGTPWFEAVKQAKKETAGNPELDWKQLVVKRVGPPPRLSLAYREVADALYPSLALALTGENPGGRALPLAALLERIKECLAQ